MEKYFCCGYKTIQTRGDYEICPVCFWEDEIYAIPSCDSAGNLTLKVLYQEGVTKIDAIIDEPSGANHGLTLRQGRENFLKFGACLERFAKNVRKPFEDEC